MVKMNPNFIKDKMLMMQEGTKGKSAQINFLQESRYDKELQFKILKFIKDIENAPNMNYGELNFLCDKYGSDKGSNFDIANNSIHPYSWLPHTYTDIYEVLFKDIRSNVKNVFECGIGTDNVEIKSNMSSKGNPGASLRVWKDYFINATIYGADIDKNCLFQEERITTSYIDQTSEKDIINCFENFNVKFDVIIDDGLHTGAAALSLFKNAISYLNINGIYCIEDLSIEGIEVLQEYFSKHLNEFIVKYAIMQTANRLNNNLIIIKRIN